jgi:hypothetical protein
MQVSFGSGSLVGIPSGSNPTPAPFGVLQSVDIDFGFTLKELYGQLQSPVAVARAAQKITGKAAVAQISARAFNTMFFNQTLTTSSGILQKNNETGTIPAPSGPYTITVANSATWSTDLGVFFSATGVQLVRVASGPTTGQYSVAAGVYTFAAADASLGVYISYLYTTASGASKITIGNDFMGAGPTFQINLAETYNSKVLNLQLNACTSGKLAMPFKNQDFTIMNFEFEAYADASNTVGYITTSE